MKEAPRVKEVEPVAHELWVKEGGNWGRKVKEWVKEVGVKEVKEVERKPCKTRGLRNFLPSPSRAKRVYFLLTSLFHP